MFSLRVLEVTKSGCWQEPHSLWRLQMELFASFIQWPSAFLGVARSLSSRLAFSNLSLLHLHWPLSMPPFQKVTCVSTKETKDYSNYSSHLKILNSIAFANTCLFPPCNVTFTEIRIQNFLEGLFFFTFSVKCYALKRQQINIIIYLNPITINMHGTRGRVKIWSRRGTLSLSPSSNIARLTLNHSKYPGN